MPLPTTRAGSCSVSLTFWCLLIGISHAKANNFEQLANAGQCLAGVFFMGLVSMKVKIEFELSMKAILACVTWVAGLVGRLAPMTRDC